MADIATVRKRIELQTIQLQKQADKLQAQASSALSMGNTDVVREALARCGAIDDQIAKLRIQHEKVAREEQNLVAASRRFTDVERSRTKRHTARWEDGETFDRFTERARLVLVLAQEEARLLDHAFVGTEHILLGLLHEGEGVAAKALQSLGISLTAARAKVEETIGMAGSPPNVPPPFTPRAKKVLELSLREAQQLGHRHIGTEHLLLGLVREGEGVAAQVLVSLGVDLGRVRQQVIQRISGDQGRSVLGAPTGTSRRNVAGWGNSAVGCRWSAEVVVAGRGPSEFATAYDQLVELARRLGLDDVNESHLYLSSVDTDRGPGLRLSVIHDLPAEEVDDQDDQPDARSSGGAGSPTPLPDDDRGSAEESESGETS